jgi:hypothetical protein
MLADTPILVPRGQARQTKLTADMPLQLGAQVILTPAALGIHRHVRGAGGSGKAAAAAQKPGAGGVKSTKSRISSI